MAIDLSQRIADLRSANMLRSIPADGADARAIVDFSTNDYLGLAADPSLHDRFMEREENRREPFTSSASRLLASRQSAYSSLEATLGEFYNPRQALLFNSGYHANTGMVPVLTGLFRRPLILADKLVHASIIDGIILSRAEFRRFPHGDFSRLERMIERAKSGSDHPDGIIIVVESVYSMDGDRADTDRLIDIKRRFTSPDCEIMLYVDEAHAVGVEGPAGLGLVASSSAPCEVDVTIGTMGKALASSGAFALMTPELRTWALNHARSFIFSTSLPPIAARWSEWMIRTAVAADTARARLRSLAAILDPTDCRYIYPAITGSAESAVELSRRLLSEEAIKVLPIRTPTVPPGTERLRISLSAAIEPGDVDRLRHFLDTNIAR